MAKNTRATNRTSVMWLDREHNDECKTVIEELRRATDHLELFISVGKCEAAVRRSNTPVVLIVSGQMGQELVPRIHNLPQLTGILIFCSNKERNKQWSKSFSKVTDSSLNLNYQSENDRLVYEVFGS